MRAQDRTAQPIEVQNFGSKPIRGQYNSAAPTDMTSTEKLPNSTSDGNVSQLVNQSQTTDEPADTGATEASDSDSDNTTRGQSDTSGDTAHTQQARTSPTTMASERVSATEAPPAAMLPWAVSCKVTKFIKVASGFGDLAGIFGISVERFVFITYALNHDQILTTRRTVALATAMVVYILASAVAIVTSPMDFPVGKPCIPKHATNLRLLSILGIPFVIAVFPTVALFYYKIARLAYSKRDKVSPPLSANQNAAHRSRKSDWKVTKTLSIVIGVFAVTYVPYSLVITVVPDGVWIQEIFAMLWNLNTFINPVIYGYRNTQFKRAFRSLLHVGTPGEASGADRTTGTQ